MTASTPVAATPHDAKATQTLPFGFTGNGWEFFKIWIVNILLTILTLGVYSAWAKVRTQQYFYGNTLLDGASFRYTAKPLTILKGRIIAVLAFAAFLIAEQIAPVVALVMSLLFLVLIPVIIVRAMTFHLGNSVYRNVSFGFRRSYKQAYAVFLAPLLALVGLMAIFGLGAGMISGGDKAAAGGGIALAVLAYLLGLPFFNYLASKFYIGNSRYGDSDFRYASGAGGFYKVYGLTVLLALGVMLLVGALLGALGGGTLAALGAAGKPGGEAGAGQLLMLLMSQGVILLIVVPAYMLIYAFFKARLFNLIYDNSVLADSYGFRADLRTQGLLWLYLSNMLIIVFTLGLGIPWTKVRTARYHLANLKFNAVEDLNRFAAAQREKTGALGDEMGEVFDLELGI